MKKYHQLTAYQRYQLAALKKEGHMQTTIAANLGVDASTISRELGRNRGQRGYRPGQAQQKKPTPTSGGRQSGQANAADDHSNKKEAAPPMES